MKAAKEKRYDRTIKFLTEFAPPPASIFDLGTPNPFSKIMEEQ